MKITLKHGALGLAALLLLGCMDTIEGAKRAKTGEVTVDLVGKPWVFGSGGWTRSAQDKYEYILSVTPVDGMTALCGVSASKGHKNAAIFPKLMGDLQIWINGQKFFQGFDHFTKAKFGDDLRRIPATCEVSNIPWNKAYGDPDNWEKKRRGNGNYRIPRS